VIVATGVSWIGGGHWTAGGRPSLTQLPLLGATAPGSSLTPEP